MSLKTFKGGIHPVPPHEGKELSKDKPIKEILPEGELVFPLSQHIGAPAKPIVAVGDTVLRGQKIGEAGGFVSAPVCLGNRTTPYSYKRHGEFDSYRK